MNTIVLLLFLAVVLLSIASPFAVLAPLMLLLVAGVSWMIWSILKPLFTGEVDTGKTEES